VGVRPTPADGQSTQFILLLGGEKIAQAEQLKLVED